MLECPQLYRRQIEHASSAVVQIVDLDPVVKHAHPTKIAVVGRRLWRDDLSARRQGGRVQKRPGHEAEAGWFAPETKRAAQRTLPRMNSMKVPVGTPVGPFGIVTRSVSE